MNKDDRAILIAMAIGDGYIQSRVRLQSGKYPYVSAELRVFHSITQINYAKWKAERVRKILGGKFQVKIHPDTGPDKKYTLCGFVKSHKCFRYMRKWCYPNGKKYLSKKILNMLSPEGLAIWWMDDGHLHHNVNKEGRISSVHGSLSTYCSKEESENVVFVLKERFGIDCKIGYEKSKRSYIVRFNNVSCKKLFWIIEPFVITEMLYKINPNLSPITGHERETP